MLRRAMILFLITACAAHADEMAAAGLQNDRLAKSPCKSEVTLTQRGKPALSGATQRVELIDEAWAPPLRSTEVWF